MTYGNSFFKDNPKSRKSKSSIDTSKIRETDPAVYWNCRYSGRGTSGHGSIGEYRKWKWKIIEQYARELDSVVDVGCGDLSFWEGRDCKNYTGIDFSQYVIEKNRTMRPSWRFINGPAEKRYEIETKFALCLDMLFHVPDDHVYVNILENIATYARNFIFIFTWWKNPLSSLRMRVRMARRMSLTNALRIIFKIPQSDGFYLFYRDFESYTNVIYEKGFYLSNIYKCPLEDGTGAMYVFVKPT